MIYNKKKHLIRDKKNCFLSTEGNCQHFRTKKEMQKSRYIQQMQVNRKD